MRKRLSAMMLAGESPTCPSAVSRRANSCALATASAFAPVSLMASSSSSQGQATLLLTLDVPQGGKRVVV